MPGGHCRFRLHPVKIRCPDSMTTGSSFRGSYKHCGLDCLYCLMSVRIESLSPISGIKDIDSFIHVLFSPTNSTTSYIKSKAFVVTDKHQRRIGSLRAHPHHDYGTRNHHYHNQPMLHSLKSLTLQTGMFLCNMTHSNGGLRNRFSSKSE